MDGLLIDTEPLWRKAEIQVFASVGLHITEEDCLKTMGLRVDEAVGYWFERQPWTGKTVAEISDEILAQMVVLVRAEGKALPGVHDCLNFLQEKKIPLLLASSSPSRLIEVILEHLGIRERFEGVFSAEKEPYGKPHPGVFITAAEWKGSDPTKCLVFEDSFNGVLAAKAARMLCIAIPEEMTASDTRFTIADVCLKSMTEFTPELWAGLQQ